MHGVEGMAVRLLGCFLAWWHGVCLVNTLDMLLHLV